MRFRNSRGYTLIELVVTVLIIGILTSIAVPQYLKTVETGKADDAVSTVNMIGTTNKMFALDHAATYVTGQFTTACGAGACPIAGPYSNPCDLVYCKYLADEDWGSLSYSYAACDPGGGGGGVTCAVSYTASAARAATANGPYNTWSYRVAQTGSISATVGAPLPTF